MNELHNMILIDIENHWGGKKSTKFATSEANLAFQSVLFNGKSYVIPDTNIKVFNDKKYAVLQDESKDPFVVYYDCCWLKTSLLSPNDVLRDKDNEKLITLPWVGIIHHAMKIPQIFDHIDMHEIIQNLNFQRSLAFCKFIIVHHETQREFLEQHIKLPCEVITLPNVYVPMLPMCDHEHKTKHRFFKRLFMRRRKPQRLIQVGFWFMRVTSIWNASVPDKWTKHWFIHHDETNTDAIELLNRELQMDRASSLMKLLSSNQQVKVHRFDKHSALLKDIDSSTDVLFMDHDESCVYHDVIMFAIAHIVPIVLKRSEGVTQSVLGCDYCLYYDDLSDVCRILSDATIERARCQLLSLKTSLRNNRNISQILTEHSILIDEDRCSHDRVDKVIDQMKILKAEHSI